MTTVIDTNILIALTRPDDVHREWATEQVAKRQAVGPMLVTDIVYSEFSIALSTQEQVDTTLSQLGFERVGSGNADLFIAGKAFRKYKTENSGPKVNVLPDFLIGAFAEAEEVPLLTCNSKDFLGYFQSIKIIAPDASSSPE